MTFSLMAQQEQQVGRILAKGTLHGRWSVESLDTPTPGWKLLENDRRSAITSATRNGRSPNCPPMTPFRNLAREWIEANEKEWHAMLAEALDQEQIAV